MVVDCRIDEDAFFYCRFHLAVELGIVVVVCVQGLFNFVADYLGRLPDVIEGIFHHDHVAAAALAQAAAFGG